MPSDEDTVILRYWSSSMRVAAAAPVSTTYSQATGEDSINPLIKRPSQDQGAVSVAGETLVMKEGRGRGRSDATKSPHTCRKVQPTVFRWDCKRLTTISWTAGPIHRLWPPGWWRTTRPLLRLRPAWASVLLSDRDHGYRSASHEEPSLTIGVREKSCSALAGPARCEIAGPRSGARQAALEELVPAAVKSLQAHLGDGDPNA